MPVFGGTPAKRQYFEKEYQQAWCSNVGGEREVILPDKARVDCVTATHAIEFDFAAKWGESIGQALYYGTALKKTPGIVLIMEDAQRDEKYLKRVQAVATKHGITVWTITPEYVFAYYNESASEKQSSLPFFRANELQGQSPYAKMVKN